MLRQTWRTARVASASFAAPKGTSASPIASAPAHSPLVASSKAPALGTAAGIALSASFGLHSCQQSCTYCSAAPSYSSLPSITLYQYEPCPYCCKVKAVLDYLDLPYNVVEVNPVTKKETKAFTDHKKVPVCRIGDDEIVVESSDIISRLQQVASETKSSSVFDTTDACSKEDEDAWRHWVDKNLIILLPPNIYRSFPEAIEAFDYCLTEGKFTAIERYLSKYLGAVIMYLVAKRSKKKYSVEDERQALYDALDEWMEAVGDQHFLGGDHPNLADLSVYGVVRALTGLRTYDDVMQHSHIQPWFSRMEKQVGATSRVH